MRLRVCHPDELPALLPDALAGAGAILPVLDPKDAAPFHPDEDVDAPGTAVVVTTSGSSGDPKGVLLSASAMLASAAATRERLGGPMAWYSPLPRQWVAGLMTLVRAHEARTRAVAVRTDLADLPPASRDEPRALSIVPTHLHRAFDHPDVLERLRGFATILLGGAPASPDLLARARAAGLPVVTTYGMSETCGGCVYDGVPLPGVDVQADPATGRLSIGGPVLFSGYRLRPALTDQALVGSRMLTQDRGRVTKGRVEVVGRVDDVVITGGVNVDLARMQRVLDDLGERAAVVAVPDAEWGQRIVLVVEDAAEATGTPPDLPQWRDRLGAAGVERPALPRQLVVTPRLPVTDRGKIDRQALAQLAQCP